MRDQAIINGLYQEVLFISLFLLGLKHIGSQHNAETEAS